MIVSIVMSTIPQNFLDIMNSINDELIEEGIPIIGRPIHAVLKMGKILKISLPIVTAKNGAPDDVLKNLPITEAIHAWMENYYGESIDLDPSDNRTVAVCANGDIWKLKLPIVYGLITPIAVREIGVLRNSISTHKNGRAIEPVNAVNFLHQITQERANSFSEADLNEVYGFFVVGLDVFQNLTKWKDYNQLFVETVSDIFSAVMHMTSQRPNYGQSRYASLQATEKYMKGFANTFLQISLTKLKKASHNLDKLHNMIADEVEGFDLEHLVADIRCNAGVRYGEGNSSKSQAILAHKASLLLMRALGSVC